MYVVYRVYLGTGSMREVFGNRNVRGLARIDIWVRFYFCRVGSFRI